MLVPNEWTAALPFISLCTPNGSRDGATIGCRFSYILKLGLVFRGKSP